MTEQKHRWRFAIDRGGTFTDIVALDPTGAFHALKLLSDSPLYPDASVEGIRRILGIHAGGPLPEDKIDSIRLGTTVATNALLERKGGKVALCITKGFEDLLEIGYQNRPDIFTLCTQKPPLLYSAVIPVDERIDCDGRVIRTLSTQGLRENIREAMDKGFDAAAVVLMHAWKNPAHELRCEEVLREHGLTNIMLSHRTINLIKIVSRGQSTLVDAYLSTVLAGYLQGIKRETGQIPVEFMQSNGMLSPPEMLAGKNALFSGPAGGVMAVARIATETDTGEVIGFDMGGTSTDVSRYDGTFDILYEKEVQGTSVQAEMLNINTVAAGGGSILGFDGSKMTVGPESAGSYPGPACYGFGGPLTITDANLITGRLIPEYFPKTFGPARNASLDSAIVDKKFSTLTQHINDSLGTVFTPREVAAGFLRIANEKMAIAIKEISVSKGFDVRKYALVCFGGAGGQHACAIASLLDMEKIIIHPLGSMMSAYGIGFSHSARKTEQTVLIRYARGADEKLEHMFREMEARLFSREQWLRAIERDTLSVKREFDLRPRGTEMFLSFLHRPFEETMETFREQYQTLFGFYPEDREIEVVNLRVAVQETADFFISYREPSGQRKEPVSPSSYRELFHYTGGVQAPVYRRETLPEHFPVRGPAFILDSNSTIVVNPGFEATLDSHGFVLMKRLPGKKEVISALSGRPDPVLLEVFNSLFTGIATEMGITLRNAAHSVNIKERLDFSCAVFDAEGNLVANAPHVPVHLGAMSDTVKEILRENRDSMKPGDVYLTNNPYRGGSHLPDMTVVCPVFSAQGSRIFFTAARGHHADMGGTAPGSMPPHSSHINEEGVLVDNCLLVRDKVFRTGRLKEILTGHQYPVRDVEERISDLMAQVAACNKGANALHRVISRYGLRRVTEYMGHIQDNAEYAVKKALQKFLGHDNNFFGAFADHLDDGTPVKATVSIDGGNDPPSTLTITVDFTGTGTQHRNDNLNAPVSVTRSAVLYVLRVITGADIPLNSGCLNPVEMIIPAGTLLAPAYPSPVATGNVETSQRVVDVLLGAFGIASASQGTMNNLLLQVNGEQPYYETIAGGAGAIDGCRGASGIQVHMTNTRITDPEILEFRHPGVRLERFTLRENSGGNGKFPGGDGVIREIQFLRHAIVAILSERRIYPPYGIRGGKPGKKGVNMLKKADGSTEVLGHRAVLEVCPGDTIIIETPGGGGYGPPGNTPN